MIRKSYKGSTELGLNVPWRVLKAKYDRDNRDMVSREPSFWVLPGFKQVDDKCCIALYTDWVEFTDYVVRSIA